MQKIFDTIVRLEILDFGEQIDIFKEAFKKCAAKEDINVLNFIFTKNEVRMKDISMNVLFLLGMYFQRELDNNKDDRYVVAMWPESQEFMGRPDCYFINDDNGLEDFGSSAYFVPENIYNLVINNNEPNDNG